MKRASGIGRFFGFAVAPMLSAISPLLLLPVLTRVAGPDGWAALASAQAIGTVAGTACLYSWSVFGPPMVTGALGEVARHLLHTSIVMRGLLSLVGVPSAIVVTSLLVPDRWQVESTLLSASSVVAFALSIGWYFVGLGRPLGYLFIETAPRTGAVLVSAIVLLNGAPLWTYPLITLSTEVLIVALGWVFEARRNTTWRLEFRQILELLREHWRLSLSGLASLGYTRASTPIVAAVNFGAAPQFAAADRMQAISRTALKPLTQTFQAWVYDAMDRPQLFARRALRASVAVISVGLLISLALAAGLPTFGHLLFGNDIALDGTLSTLVGIAVFLISISSSTATFYLVPLRQTRTIAMSLLVCSLAGIPAIAISAAASAPTGPLFAIAAVELVVAIWQTIVVRRAVTDYVTVGVA